MVASPDKALLAAPSSTMLLLVLNDELASPPRPHPREKASELQLVAVS